ncbi:hypothetical protein BDA96_06G110400 [Sorghum bicolor]|uniref:Uncharacterized protein n=2 Tax=Sorghum bicolor TaxID=4558 RepID=A0A921UC27_SORBI|nr:hypothetical protein BDA96_06G110400 [Sorghum bicolor]OQU81671.1 hypothetical protein SORBI_3006G100150 [Sorghum bicolor]
MQCQCQLTPEELNKAVIAVHSTLPSQNHGQTASKAAADGSPGVRLRPLQLQAPEPNGLPLPLGTRVECSPAFSCRLSLRQ